ncbi:MAG: hypothetical protein COT74_01205 [Bdellovibrionales bacterium CG10_big_fil_rev_8_21_14_0_10_45_34]|nr:MAG: hypothetical protein COT74_01205 [Bdellovibrionales bacterium CG10_big_fil_rev_8_21_14_0_10_45_34]
MRTLIKFSILVRGITWAALIVSGPASAAAASGPNELEKFSTDGCSSWVEGPVWNRQQWAHCCQIHDVAYWVGGTYEERLTADSDFKKCIQDTGDEVAANTMYFFVRQGGGPCNTTSYRWGFGWKYTPGYRELTSEEANSAKEMMPENPTSYPIVKPRHYFRGFEPDQPEMICGTNESENPPRSQYPSSLP